MTDRTVAPRIVDAVDFNPTLQPIETHRLDNGVPLYALNAGVQDVLLLEWVFYAGNWYEDAHTIAYAVSQLLKNGTSTRTALEISEAIDYYGATLKTEAYNETAVISISTLSKHLPALLPIVQEMITDAIFPEEELNIFRNNKKQLLEVNLKKCDFVANRLIDQYLFGSTHPYGKVSTAETYDALSREAMLLHYDRFYRQGRCLIFAAGKLPPDLGEQLNKSFGHLPINNVIPELKHNMVPAVEKKYRVSNDPGGVQGAVQMALPFPNRHHPDFKRVMVLNTLFGGFFGSRLMSNIREEKGYTYGIYSYLQNHIESSAWMITSEAGRDVCEKVIEEIHHEMKTLREELVDDEELLQVRNYMMGSILGDLDGPFHVLSRWKNIILNGLDESYFYDSMKAIKTISAEELRELSAKYLNPEAFYELVVI